MKNRFPTIEPRTAGDRLRGLEVGKSRHAMLGLRNVTFSGCVGIRSIRVLFLALIAMAAVMWGRLGHAAEVTVPWLVGSALQQRMDATVDIVWSGNPLRQALHNLSRAQRVAVFLDRRVDPEQRVDVKLAAMSLTSVLRQIAASRQLGVAMLGPVAYFGPLDSASRIRTLAAVREEEVRQLRSAAARRLLHPKRMAWADFASPRDLLAQLAEEGGVELGGVERVPHDLWAAADLPPLSWVDRVTLIAIQFNLTFRIEEDGRKMQLVSVPESVLLVRSYPSGVNPAAMVERFSSLAPAAQVKVVSGRVYVRGLLEDHERIASPATALRADSSAKHPPPSGAKILVSRFAVQEKPVGKVLEQMAIMLKLELHMDRQALQEAGISLDQRVSVQVENGSIDDALRGLLRTTPLAYRRQGNVVEIVPKNPGAASRFLER